MLSRIGFSSARAFPSASGPHGYQSTGLCACCNKYGLVSPARRLGTVKGMPSDEDLPWDASVFLPREIDLDHLREAAAHCEACDLFRSGTQTVFGQGLSQADVMFIGEQPGDQEDRAGQPFVGPAGRVLDEGLDEVGIDRTNVY